MNKCRCVGEKNCLAKEVLFQLLDIEYDTLRLLDENDDWFGPEKMDLLNEAIEILKETRLEILDDVWQEGCPKVKHWPVTRDDDPFPWGDEVAKPVMPPLNTLPIERV